MTDVIFRIGHDTTEGVEPHHRRITATPSMLRVDGDVIVLPANVDFSIPHDSDSITIQMAATSPSWAWKVALPTQDWVWVQVPDSPTPVEFADLTRIDPETLDPIAEPEAAWWARMNEVLAVQSAAESARDIAVGAASDSESARDTAVGAKDDAESAQTAAESARDQILGSVDDAENARDAAVVAQGLAEDARDTAEDFRDDTDTLYQSTLLIAPRAIYANGRPDIPGTLIDPGSAAAVASAPVGTAFVSLDGPQGAWVWLRRPTGWVVTEGDTDWRLLASGTLPDPLLNGWEFTVPGGGIQVRRTNLHVTIEFRYVEHPSVVSSAPLDPPQRFAGRLPSIPFSRGGVNNEVRAFNPGTWSIRTVSVREYINGQASYLVGSAAWPTTLPGTPA